MKPLILSFLLTLPAATPALAQTDWVEIDDGVTVTELGETVDEIEEWDVIGLHGREIGEVEDVLGTEPGAATALVLELEDEGGLGVRNEVIAPLDRFSMEDGRLVLNADAAAIRQMKEYYGE